MKTAYYCTACKVHFFEEKAPNMNKKHRRCGQPARIIDFEKDGGEDGDAEG